MIIMVTEYLLHPELSIPTLYRAMECCLVYTKVIELAACLSTTVFPSPQIHSIQRNLICQTKCQ